MPLILLFLAAVVSLHAQTLQHTEVLGRPTASSVTVQFFVQDSVDVCVQYGTESGVYPQQTPWIRAHAGEHTEIVLNALTPNTAYVYRTCLRMIGRADSITRPEFRFHTQRSPGSTYSFVVQADPHMDEQTDTAIYHRCLLNQLEDAPDFMVDLGDFLMSDKLKNAAGKITHDTITSRCHLLRSAYELSCHSIPLFIALGNHEGEAGWLRDGTANTIPVWGTNDRKRYFVNPEPNSFYRGDTTVYPFVGRRQAYYAWTWGDALFIVLDPYWSTSPKPDSLNGWRWTLGRAQYDWLQQTLEQSTATYRFVFAHQLVGGDPDGRGGVEFADRYEWGGKDLDGADGWERNRPGWPKPIKDLLTEHRVNIFFHGHDHFFARQVKDCLIYQETPQPSHPNFQNAGQADDYGYVAGQILPNSGHLRVTVSPANVKVEYVRVYVPKNENANRHNKDVSATYFINATNCYDSVNTGIPVLWNANYINELVYPNPFPQQTTLAWSTLTSEIVTLSIVDAQGITLRSLIVNSELAAGSYQTQWDGLDAAGRSVPNGAYRYVLHGSRSGTHTGSIILQR